MNLAYRSAIIGVLLLSSPGVSAREARETHETCKYFRLDGRGGSMEHIPVRDQLYFGTCFANSGVDVVDAIRLRKNPELLKKPPEEALTSPMIAAMQAASADAVSKPGRLGFEGGNACELINKIKDSMTCSIKAERAFMEAGRHYIDWVKKASIDRSEAEMSLLMIYAKCLSDKERGMLEQVFNEIDRDDLLTTVLDPDVALKKIVSAICPHRPRTDFEAPIPACREVPTQTPRSLIEGVHAFFDHTLEKSLPMEITYCSKVLRYGPPYSGVIKNNGRQPQVKSDLCIGYNPNNPKDEGGHSSVVVGRRFNSKTKTCQLLVKNSWGQDCSPYSPYWDCEKDGKVWVDQDALSRNTVSYSFLEEKR